MSAIFMKNKTHSITLTAFQCAQAKKLKKLIYKNNLYKLTIKH